MTFQRQPYCPIPDQIPLNPVILVSFQCKRSGPIIEQTTLNN